MTKFIEVRTSADEPVTINVDVIETIHKDRRGIASISFRRSGGTYGGGITTNEPYSEVVMRLQEALST